MAAARLDALCDVPKETMQAEAAESFTHKISDVERLQFRSMTALAVSKAPRVLRVTVVRVK